MDKKPQPQPQSNRPNKPMPAKKNDIKDQYTATVVWSPEVTDKFGYDTVYTATITITPKTNYTVKGIAENGYTVSGAETVTNEANSATVTAVYSATGSYDTVDTNEFTKPLEIVGWTYGIISKFIRNFR